LFFDLFFYSFELFFKGLDFFGRFFGGVFGLFHVFDSLVDDGLKVFEQDFGFFIIESRLTVAFNEFGAVGVIEFLEELFAVLVIFLSGFLPVDFLYDFFLGNDLFVELFPVLFEDGIP
jgi:hypothetical protein